MWCALKLIVMSAMNSFISKVWLKSHQFPQWYTSQLFEPNCVKTLRRKYIGKSSAVAKAKLNREVEHLEANLVLAKWNCERQLFES